MNKEVTLHIESIKKHKPDFSDLNSDDCLQKCIDANSQEIILEALENHRQLVLEVIGSCEFCNGLEKAMEIISKLPASKSETTNMVDIQVAKNAVCNACGNIDCDLMDTCKKLVF